MKHPLLAILALCIFATIPVYIENISANLWFIGAFRLSCAVLLGFLFLDSKKHFLATFKKNRFPYLLLGILFFIHWLTYFYAIKTTTGSYGVLGISTYGIQLSFMGKWFQKEKWTSLQWGSVAMILGGLLLIFPLGIGWGFSIGILSGFFYACIPLLHKKFIHIQNNYRTLGQFIVACICFLITYPLWNLPEIGPGEWLKLLYMGIAGTFVAHSIWIYLSTQWKPQTTGTIYYLIIPLTLTLNTWVNEESHSLPKIIGSFMVVSANLLLSWQQHKRSS